MSTLDTFISQCETVSPLTLATTIITLLATLFLTYFKGRKKFCGGQAAPEEEILKLPRKTRNRIKKMHMNIEALMRQGGLEVASVS